MLSSQHLSNIRNSTTKLGIKYVRISYQLEYLKLALQQKFLPRGIANLMKYVSPIHDSNLQDSLQNLMYFAGSRMLDLLVIYYTTWTNNLRRSYYSSLASLENQLTIREYDSYKSELNYKLAKEKGKAMKTSKSKLKRDRDVVN